MITLDNQPLMIDVTGELEEFIVKFIPTDQYLPWLRRSWPGFGNAGLTYPTGMRYEPRFKLNQFRWPTGASRWAYGHFLADVEACNLQKVINDAFGTSSNAPPGMGGAYNPIPLVLDTSDSGGERLNVSVYLMPPVPLSGMRGVNGLYLMTVVDQRFFWWYNYVGLLQITSGWTWTSLYSWVASSIGIVSFKTDSIDPKYLQPSTMFNLPYESAPQILDAIAFNVGQRVIRNYDGSVYCQNYTTALKALNDDFKTHPNRIKIAGDQRFPDKL
jgi:hypothetical protein